MGLHQSLFLFSPWVISLCIISSRAVSIHNRLGPTQNPVTYREAKTAPLRVQWRLEERKQWIPSTPWLNLETGAGPADRYLLPALRALWSECSSEEHWHFRHFAVWVRTSWPDPRPHPSVLPKICRETANMAAGCWSGDQAVGLGRRPLPDGWFCGINRTADLTCTAVDHWRKRPLPDGWFCDINQTEDLTCMAVDGWRRRTWVSQLWRFPVHMSSMWIYIKGHQASLESVLKLSVDPDNIWFGVETFGLFKFMLVLMWYDFCARETSSL